MRQKFGRDTYTPKPETLFQPRPLQTQTIAQVYLPTYIGQLGTEEPYHKTYTFWTNPEHVITTENLATFYCYCDGKDFIGYKHYEEIGLI